MQWVASLISLGLLMVVIVVDVGYTRRGWKVARAMGLPQDQTLRYVRTLVFGPAMALLAVGVLLGADVTRSWEHALACVLGAGAGVWVGNRRYRTVYVRAEPDHRAIVVSRSLLEYRVLTILILVRIAAIHDRLPALGWLSLVLSFLLTAAVFEAIGRSWLSYQRYWTQAGNKDR